jgi:hypothetical protein
MFSAEELDLCLDTLEACIRFESTRFPPIEFIFDENSPEEDGLHQVLKAETFDDSAIRLRKYSTKYN